GPKQDPTDPVQDKQHDAADHKHLGQFLLPDPELTGPEFPFASDNLLRPEPENDHVYRHDQTHDDQTDVKGQERQEDLVIHEVGAAEPGPSLKRQDPQLAEQVIAGEERKHRAHAPKNNPVVHVAHFPFGLHPADDEQCREEHGHDLSQLPAQRRRRPKETGSSQELLHLIPWTRVERSSSSTDVNPASFNHWTVSAMV